MKRRLLSLVFLCILAGGLGAFALLRFKPSTPPLKPTAKQLAAAFPAGSRSILRESDTLILYRLTGSAFRTEKGDFGFDGYPMVGKTIIRDKATRQKIITAYEEGLADTNFSAACFNPRHGIRVEKNKQRLDLVICFSCGQVKVIFKGQESYVHMGKQPQAVFDEVLGEASVER